eukprot:TRINITY_DN6606_c0_g1_i1.p1 TRINITY_DN6606_c0_g1~~TRINITY_DN6606_c0_g1_i1.p1  ORF type:complete len:206 (-),score=25.79 TRINITY_DN6606_c0_g1_i1:401-1018(-)
MYGQFWDVVTIPNPNNIAYTNASIPYHQDLCYYEAMPGIQILHCLSSEVEGGENGWLDGFKIAEDVLSTDPFVFDALTQIPITYHKIDEENQRISIKPIISLNFFGEVESLYHSPPWEGPLRVPFYLVEPLYQAYSIFHKKYVQNPKYSIVTKFNQGEAMVFYNRRIFHSRSLIKVGGSRHLQGCYVSHDDFLNTWRLHKSRCSE